MADEKKPTWSGGVFLFPSIFQTFRISIQPAQMLLAFGALAIICLTGSLLDITSNNVAVGPSGLTELDRYVSTVLDLDEYVGLLPDETGEQTGVFAALWRFNARRFHSALRSLLEVNVYGVTVNVIACFVALWWALSHNTVYSIIFFAVVLGVLSLAGAAICRIAALQFAQGERLGLGEAVRFATRKFVSFLTAPLTPLAIILVIGLFIALLGLWGNIPVVGELSVGLSLPLAFGAAAVAVIIAIGTVAGFSLMFPAIAYEDSDCFDAIGRSFGYVYARPWWMAFYVAVAFGYGAVCYIFVRLFSFLVVWMTYAFVQLGFVRENTKLHAIWPEPNFADFLGTAVSTPDNWSTTVAGFLITMWVLAVVGLMVSFVISFYFCASTIIYALMRSQVDKIPLEEVYSSSGEPTVEPFSLPTGAEEAPSEAQAATEQEGQTPG